MVVGYHHFRKPPFSLHEKVSGFQTLPLEQTCAAFLASLCETFGFHRPAKIILKTPFQQNLNLNSPLTSSKLKTRCIYRCMTDVCPCSTPPPLFLPKFTHALARKKRSAFASSGEWCCFGGGGISSELLLLSLPGVYISTLGSIVQ